MNLIEITKGCESKQNEQTEQMKSLPDTKIIEDKQEAISIINDVAALIERTYKKIIK